MTLSMRRIVSCRWERGSPEPLFLRSATSHERLWRAALPATLRDEKGWKAFDANGCVNALHNGTSEVGRRPPRVSFWAKDIEAARQELTGRGIRCRVDAL